MQALIFGQDKYFCREKNAEICQTGYKQGECTKTIMRILALLLKERVFPKFCVKSRQL